jgi:hypothetical protein
VTQNHFDICNERTVPSPGCLLQLIQRLVEETDAIGLHRINKSSRLAVVDGLRKGVVQEHIRQIELMNRLGAGDGSGEHGADRGRLDHQAEGLIVIDVGSLGEAVKNPTSLVPFQGAVRIKLMLENPLAGDDVGANGTRDKIPDVAGDQDSKFFFHAAASIWIDEGGADGGHR